MILRRLLPADTAAVPALSALLRAVLDQGASVGFLASDTQQHLDDYWQGVLASLGAGLFLWVAEAEGVIVGAVQLAPCQRSNGSHRADVQKLLVLPSSQGSGVGTALMEAVESHARQSGLTLLVLDTHSGSPAERLYRRLGWQTAGSIPGYAAVPDGTLISTTYFFKPL